MKRITSSILIALMFVAVTGVAQATPVNTVPDVGSTSSLIAIAMGGLAVLRRYLR